MAVITISRQFGAGGWTLAERLQARLGYGCINEDMIKEAAVQLNVSEGHISYFEKDGASRLMKFIDKMISPNFIDRHISDRYGYVNEKSYVEVIKNIIFGIHDKGNMIIVGRGAQFILKDHPNTFHFLLVQKLESRIQFVMNKYKMSLAQAEKDIKQRDQNRDRFLAFFAEKAEVNNPINYHLVMNMDRIGLDQAEDMIANLISK